MLLLIHKRNPMVLVDHLNPDSMLYMNIRSQSCCDTVVKDLNSIVGQGWNPGESPTWHAVSTVRVGPRRLGRRDLGKSLENRPWVAISTAMLNGDAFC